MKQSLKAALFSGLVFPGIGHIVLRAYFRGTALAILSLAALSVIVTSVYQRALIVFDQIISGDVAMEAGAIAQAVSDSTNAENSLADNAAVIVLIACWLAGIIDSYRHGALQEKSNL